MKRAYIIVVLAAVLGVMLSQGGGLDDGVPPQQDLLQYWSAAKLFAAGGNPYDPDAMQRVQAPHLKPDWEFVRMWNPPLLLPLIYPMAYLGFDEVRVVWFMVCVALVAAAFSLVISCESSPQGLGWRPLAALLTCAPLYDCLGWGQIVPLMLIGLALFEHSRFGRRAGLAGIALSLTLIKPHSLYLFYLLLLLESLRTRDLRLISYFAAGAAILLAAPLLFLPDIYELYMNAMSVPPFYWKSATIGGFLQGLGMDARIARFAPAVLAAILLAAAASRRSLERARDSVLPLSLMTAPYGWHYDQLLLLPVVSRLALSSSKLVSGAVIVLGVLYCAMPGEWGQHATIGYSAGVFVLCLWQESRAPALREGGKP